MYSVAKMLPSIESLDFRTLCAGLPVQIDFTPADVASPSGYVADNGAAYGNRNGYTYGWNVAHPADTFDHNRSSPYVTHATGIYMHATNGTRYTWEMAVASGTYNVEVVSGDIAASATANIKAEGTTVVNGTSAGAGKYLDVTKTVTVTDGRLTLTSVSTTARDPILSVRISAAAAPTSPPPPTGTGSTGGTTPDAPSTGSVTGQHLQAHGGDIIYRDGMYYWYGENKDAKTFLQSTIKQPRVDVIGISCYTSTDLHTWTYSGLALQGSSSGDLSPGNVLERPKVLYNELTGLYVMWMHIDNATYTSARVGVATSSTATGTFTYKGSFRPLGMESRDMTIFQDDDGSAYLVFATNRNTQIRIAKMTSDYRGLTGQNVTALNAKREAPELFKQNGYYYLITSGATWFAPNAAQYAVATSVLGIWSNMGNAASGSGNTYSSQGAYVFKNQATGDYYLLADRWNTSNLGASTYAFLPLSFSGKSLSIHSPASWWLTVT